MKVKIDIKDRKILDCLDMDARMPLTKLSQRVGLSRQVVEYRLKRLRKKNVVLGAAPVFDSAVVGYNWYRIAFRLLKATSTEKNAFMEYLKTHPHLSWLGEVGGNWDLVMNFVCKDNFEFNRIFEEIIARHGAHILDYEILIYIDVCDMQRAFLPGQGNRKQFSHEMKYDENMALDNTDKELIRQLNRDALAGNVQLGQRLGISPNTVKNRIDQMKQSKFLLGFRLFINPASIGKISHMLFLEITRLDVEKEQRLSAYLRTIPQVTFLVKHIGKWRMGMEIETDDQSEFQRIFIGIRDEFHDIIANFESFPLFKDHLINYFPEGCLNEETGTA